MAHLDSSWSTPSSYDEEEEPSFTGGTWQEGTTQANSVTQSPSSTTAGTSSTAAHPSKSTPLQKRRRVTRACDECRRKKIKCDGKQPCTHCTVYSYDCTYDQPSNRRRNPTPQYVEGLEIRAHRMEALLKVLLPDVDVNSPNFDFEKLPQLQQAIDRLASKGGKQDVDVGAPSQDALLESMVEAAGRLDIDESGHADFHGHSSGFTYLNKLREQFGNILGSTHTSSLLNFPPPVTASISSGLFDSPQSGITSPGSPVTDSTPLPAKDIAEILVNSCLNEACILFRFIHRPSFDVMFHQIYSISPQEYGVSEQKFLPLLYLTLAVGCAFTSDPERLGFSNGTLEGIKYFQVGRKLVDITDCRDSMSVQCVCFMILFLQSSARLSMCYSYVGIAMSASLRMGYHRKLPLSDPLEAEVRKRIFWTVRKMGIYVGTLLGLPKGIQDEDLDQEYPLEIDDQYISQGGLLQFSTGEPSSAGAANAHTRLLMILDKIGKNIYPIKGMQLSTSGHRAGYMISYATVHAIEEELETWHSELPMYLRRGEDAPVRFVRSQYLLCMWYAHVKMMLYRPFIHYIARPRDGRVRDERPYASAAECINVSREIIHISDDMRRKNILNGAYWFNIYSTFFAVISLAYFVLENISHPDAPTILRDATLGKDCLMSLRERSMAAERCCLSLGSLFDQLPSKLQAGQPLTPSAANRKRTREAPPRLSSHPLPDDVSYEQPSRSKTFPSTPDVQASTGQFGNETRPYDGSFDSYMSGTISQRNEISFQQHLGGAGGMPDLNAFMFPSSSDYAYGNQALSAETQPMFKSDPSLLNSAVPSRVPLLNDGGDSVPDPAHDILEAQLYGPLPPYLYQGQNTQAPVTNGFNVAPLPVTSSASTANSSFIPYQNINSTQSNLYPVNLDDFFSTAINDTEWDEMLLQSNYR